MYKIAVSLKLVKLSSILYTLFFSYQLCVLCGMESGAFGRERERGSYLSKSLVDCSLSMNVNLEADHLRGAWKSRST